MSRKAKVLSLLERKTAIGLRKKANEFHRLATEKATTSDLKTALHTMLEEKVSSISRVTSAAALRSDHWYALEIEQQGKIAEGKLEFLGNELRDAQHGMAAMDHRQKLYSERASLEKNRFREARETRLAQAFTPRIEQR